MLQARVIKPMTIMRWRRMADEYKHEPHNVNVFDCAWRGYMRAPKIGTLYKGMRVHYK